MESYDGGAADPLAETETRPQTGRPAPQGDQTEARAEGVPEFAEVPEEVHAALPVAELHLHIEGTLRPELIFALAERNGIALPYADLDELRARYEFTDLQSFLDLYYANMAVLQTEQDFADMTRAYLARAATAGVRHAEIMLDPQAHLSRGVALETCVNGVASVLAGSQEEFGISTLLIAAFLRDQSEDSALEVLEKLLAMDAPIAGIGLDSAEVGNPPSKFERLFARAKDAGLRRIAHAGEEGPPSYIIEALDLLEVERIDHGIRCMEDPELVERLVQELMPLTVCPLSNVRLRAVDTLAEHPLPGMLAAGLGLRFRPWRLRLSGRRQRVRPTARPCVPRWRTRTGWSSPPGARSRTRRARSRT
jgi:adenosine deaminase